MCVIIYIYIHTYISLSIYIYIYIYNIVSYTYVRRHDYIRAGLQQGQLPEGVAAPVALELLRRHEHVLYYTTTATATATATTTTYNNDIHHNYHIILYILCIHFYTILYISIPCYIVIGDTSTSSKAIISGPGIIIVCSNNSVVIIIVVSVIVIIVIVCW